MRSVSSGNMPWLSSNATNSKLVDRKKNTSDMMYPIFSDLADDTDDPYWKNFLYNCSKGKLPKGFLFNGKSLMYKNGIHQLDIAGNQHASKELIQFIRHHTKMRSKMDLEREKSIRYDIKDDSYKDWSNIRSKYTKRLLIIDYISTLKAKYNLNTTEVNEVTTSINYYLFNTPNAIISKYIVLKDNSIANISNLIFNANTRKFIFTELPPLGAIVTPKNKSKKDVIPSTDYSDINNTLVVISTLKDWSKFLKDLSNSFNRIDKKLVSISPLQDDTINNTNGESGSVSSY